ncbi:hypothetical protein C8R44DRAFT_604906, partial [Mycena epipterygia]
VDIGQTLILAHHGGFFIVSTWGNPANFDVVPWSATMIPILCGLVVATAQIFYAWRIWMFTTGRFLRAVAILIVLVTLIQGFAAIIQGFIVSYFSSPKNPAEETLIRFHPEFSVWLGVSLVADVLITACMSYILAQAKNRTFWIRSETMITRLITRVVQTGAATAICAKIDLAMFIGV